MKNPLALKAFGEHLRRIRLERRLSQQKLADSSDLARSSVVRFENASMVATIDAVISLGKALGIDPHELINFPMPKEKQPKAIARKKG
ncbi:MAG: helix-turn-helix transcriptional regulator [Bacteroidetes bacterium]|nr:helix-turn-helix transcriptional regulator [Bacteroidota bacterium]